MELHTKNKTKIIDLIITQLTTVLGNCEEAANNAHLAAVDDQSVAETQYDTLAIESAYLAEGQSRRLLAIKNEIKEYLLLKKQLDTSMNMLDLGISVGSLIKVIVESDDELTYWYFIGPSAGGNKITYLSYNITIVTLESPLGMMLKGKKTGDDYQLNIGNKEQNGFIEQVI